VVVTCVQDRVREFNMANGKNSYNCSEDSRFPSADSYLYFQYDITCCSEGTDMIERTCLICSKPFNPTSSQIKRGVGKYCSNECKWQSMFGDNNIAKRPEIRQRISEGIRNSQKTVKKGNIPWNKGKTNIYSKEVIEKISRSLIGRRLAPEHRDAVIKNLNRNGSRGKKQPRDVVERRMAQVRGTNHWNWHGGKRLALARSTHKKRERGFVLITDKSPYNEQIDYHHIHPSLPYVVPCPTRIHKMFPGAAKNHFYLVNAFLGFRFEDNNE